MFEKFRYKKFLILSLIAFIITGVVITLATLNHLKTDKIQSAKDLTLLTLNSILKPQLRSEDFQMPLPDNRVNVLNNALTEIMTDTGIMGIRIWNQKNEVIFSSNISATIDTEDINNFANLQEIEARVIKLDQSNNNIKLPNPKTLQIFTPISIDNTRIGTYEVLIPYSIVEQHLKDVALVISAFMGIGLCILYIVWLRLAFNVSRDLISHNTILTAQRNQLQNYSDMLNTTYKNTVKTLTYAIDAKDTYTAGHSQRVATISNIISVSLGLAEAEQKVIELAALFHDIGKLGIPDEILNKPGKLSELEMKKIKQHP
ncbi:MAG: HD domain-containing protein, partial [Desulfitobacterium hafniense]|nr:HD domain-containing protein [Desulfitobacterium hafniense]